MTLLRKIKETIRLRFFAFLKIPLIAHIRPVVEQLDEERCVIRFPLCRRTKNHLDSMYFGALCIGADLSGGIIAMQEIRRSGQKIHFVFKDFQADFLKRAEGDVVFTCEEGEALKELVERAAASGSREEQTVRVVATVPSRLGDEPVARFRLTISLKKAG